jgi:hypothetical protein
MKAPSANILVANEIVCISLNKNRVPGKWLRTQSFLVICENPFHHDCPEIHML